MPRIIWLAVLILLLSPATALLAGETHPCQGWSHDPPREPREGQNAEYGGVVTEVTKDTITIQWVNTPGEKPKKFAASETLAAGKVPIEPRVRDVPGRNPALPGPTMPNPVMPEYMYRLTDVKVGDCVGIFYARIGGVDICDHVRICRRPDGDVPPLPKEAEDRRRGRGILEVYKAKHPGQPLPEGLARLEKYPYVPYHEWQNAYWARQAPMPREIVIGPATAP